MNPHKHQLTMFGSGMAFLILLMASVLAYEVPLEKADPPKMNPRPTLPEITHRVFFSVSIDGEEQDDKIVIGLFGKETPKTVENFIALAECNQGNGKISGKALCYKGSPFHRIVPSFGISGGDFVFGDGTGSESIFGAPFEDESFNVKHNKWGLVSMANRGRDTNGSQFFIQTNKAQWLDGRYVAFGFVLEGHDLIREVEEYGQPSGTPTGRIIISDSGTMPLKPADKKPHYVSEWEE